MVSRQPLNSLVAVCKQTFRLMFQMCRVNGNVTGKQNRSCRRRTALVLVGERGLVRSDTHAHTQSGNGVLSAKCGGMVEKASVCEQSLKDTSRGSLSTLSAFIRIGSRYWGRTVTTARWRDRSWHLWWTLPATVYLIGRTTKMEISSLRVSCSCHHCCSRESLFTEAM